MWVQIEFNNLWYRHRRLGSFQSFRLKWFNNNIWYYCWAIIAIPICERTWKGIMLWNFDALHFCHLDWRFFKDCLCLVNRACNLAFFSQAFPLSWRISVNLSPNVFVNLTKRLEPARDQRSIFICTAFWFSLNIFMQMSINVNLRLGKILRLCRFEQLLQLLSFARTPFLLVGNCSCCYRGSGCANNELVGKKTGLARFN